MATDLSSAAAAATSALQSATSTLSGPTGVAKGLASSTFLATAKDQLAVKDVYTDVNGKSILTSVENLFSGVDLSFADLLRGGKWLANNVPTVASLARQGTAVFSAKGLTARILGSSNLATSIFGKLSSSGQAGLLSAFSDNKQLFANVNGLVQRVASTDLTNISAVGGLINQYSTDNAFFKLDDQDSQVGLFAGIIHEATSYGVPNSFAGLTSQITNTNLLGRIANKTLPSITDASDTLSLLSIGQTLGDKNTLAINPSIISEFSFKYTLPPLATNSDGTVAFGHLMNAYNAVDSGWNVCTRNTTLPDGSSSAATGINLSSVIGASSDFSSILSQGAKASSDATTQLLQMASLFSKTTVTDTLKSSFPATLFTPNAIANVVSVDPVLLGSNAGVAATAADSNLW